MPDAYRIRRAMPADLPALIALERRAFITDHLSPRQYRHHLGNPGALVLAAVAWVALWILDGPNDLTGTWAPDLVSAAALAWTVPVGVWSSARALRSAG